MNEKAPSHPPVVWAIAGTDPSGGAGLPADLKTLHALGCYAAPIVTAVVAQNTRGVRRVRRVSADLVRAQIEALTEDFIPAAVKVGMLGGAPAVRAVADALARLSAPIVCDPVLAASGGAELLDAEGIRTLISRLVPRVTVLTPNIPEAERLTGLRVRGPEDMPHVAERLRGLGAATVVLKGGHLAGPACGDFFTDGERAFWLWSLRCPLSVHGTGCVFASALAAGLARGQRPADAARWAKAYVNQGLRLALVFGGGRPILAQVPPSFDPADEPLRTAVE